TAVAGEIGSNAQQPGTQGTRCIERIQVAVGADERILSDILCIPSVTGEQVSQAKHGFLMRQHNSFPDVGIAAARPVDEFDFSQVRLRSCCARSFTLSRSAVYLLYTADQSGVPGVDRRGKFTLVQQACLETFPVRLRI